MDFYDGGDYNAGGASVLVRIVNSPADVIEFIIWNGAATEAQCRTGTTYTDTTTWHHLCVACDSTQGTPANAVGLYVDGILYPGGGLNSNPAFNQNVHLSTSGIACSLGSTHYASSFFDGKLAYFYYIDGQQLTPSSFTTGTGAGTTHPIAYTGTYGNNGFFLDFRGSSANDQSGNGNNWTPVGGPTFGTDLPT
jgi:hypothetical protein